MKNKPNSFLRELIVEVKKDGMTIIDENGNTTLNVSLPQLIATSLKVYNERYPEALKNIKNRKTPINLTIEPPK